jgi:hypothetical protein
MSMLAKAIIITGIIFIPMIAINIVLVTFQNSELLDWKTILSVGIPLVFILISYSAIKMNAGRK